MSGKPARCQKGSIQHILASTAQHSMMLTVCNSQIQPPLSEQADYQKPYKPLATISPVQASRLCIKSRFPVSLFPT